MHLSISINFEVILTISPCMVHKALSIPKNPRISRLVFCDASLFLTLISSGKDEIFISATDLVFMSVGNTY